MKSKTLLPKRDSQCLVCKTPFDFGSSYLSALFEDGETFLRKDFCLSCGKDFSKEKGYFWQGKIPLKKVEPCPFEEKALSLFRTLFSEGKEKKKLYILAELLVRQKWLYKIQKERYEIGSTGEVFQIRAFLLHSEETAAIAEDLQSDLSGNS